MVFQHALCWYFGSTFESCSDRVASQGSVEIILYTGRLLVSLRAMATGSHMAFRSMQASPLITLRAAVLSKCSLQDHPPKLLGLTMLAQWWIRRSTRAAGLSGKTSFVNAPFQPTVS